MWFVLVLLLVVVAAASGWWVYAGRPDPAQLRERLQQQLSRFNGQQWLNRLTGWVRVPPRLQTFPLGADLLKRLDRLLGTDESEPIEPMPATFRERRRDPVKPKIVAETSPETPAVATLAEPEASAMSAAPAAIERPAAVEPKPASVPPVDKPVTLSRPRTETGPTKADAAVPVAPVSKPIVPLPVVELPTAPRDTLPPQRPSQTRATARETITLPTAPSSVAAPPAPPPEIVQLPKHYRLKKTIPASTPLPKDLPVIGREELQANLQSSPLLRQAQRAGLIARPKKAPLPVIDPEEVRAQIQALHGAPPPVPGVAAPVKPVSPLKPALTPNVAKPVVNRIQPEIAIPEIVRHEKPVSKPAVLSGWINPPVVAPKPSPEQAAAVPEPEVVAPVVMSSTQASCAIQPSAVVPSISPLGESRTSVEPEVAAPVAEPTIPADNVPLSRSEILTPPTAATTTSTLLETSPRAPWHWPVSSPEPQAVPEAESLPTTEPVVKLAVPPEVATVDSIEVEADNPPTVLVPHVAPVEPADTPSATAIAPWVLLEDEPHPAADSKPVSSGLVWQVLDEPLAATTPVAPVEPSMLPSPVVVEPQVAPTAKPAVAFDDSCLPPLTLLRPAEEASVVYSEEELLERGIVIEEKLAEFKVKVSVVDAYAGPVITRYEVEPAVGVRGNQVVNLMKDLSRALGLAAIRVVETIPGKTCMGLELPNDKRQMIRLSEILSAEEFQASHSKLTIVLGKDITGEPVVTDLAKAPHLLVAGTTGSGKSVGVNAMILSLLYKATPDEVRFIMIDPKMLELSVYNDIPHLLAPVVTDMKLAANALNWCVGEMERRYRLMSALGVRNLAGYNDKVREAVQSGRKLTNPFSLTPETPEPLAPLPFIVVVVDEFADLMMVAGKKIEELIARLAQKARAAGIHLILATQRPSVDVITGLIKANIPTRIAFQVSSKVDSRTILDQMGAETLLGQGDMLFLPPGTGYPQRVHGAFVTDDEVHAVVEHLKQFGEPDYVEGLLTGESEAEEESAAATAKAQAASETDPLYDEAVEIVLRTRKASISSVQRHLRIGYNRAARLIEEMEAAGLVSSMENNGNRTVLVPQRDY